MKYILSLIIVIVLLLIATKSVEYPVGDSPVIAMETPTSIVIDEVNPKCVMISYNRAIGKNLLPAQEEVCDK